MSFKRSVERDRKIEFTHQDIQNKSEFKSQFNFTWIPFNYKSLIMLAIIFLFTQFFCVPFLNQYYQYPSALILTHGILTSFLVVLSFWTIAKEKPPLSALFVRFCFCALIFGGFALAFVLLMKL